MKTKKIVIFVITLGSLICFGVYLLIYVSTIGNRSYGDINKLLINENDLPPGWNFEYKKSITGYYQWGDENRMIGFSAESGTGFAHQYVYHFKNVFSALQGEYFLGRTLPLTEAMDEDFSHYESQFADKWYSSCYISEYQIRVCDIFARYENIITYFSISSPVDDLTGEQWDQILSAIESRIMNELSD